MKSLQELSLNNINNFYILPKNIIENNIYLKKLEYNLQNNNYIEIFLSSYLDCTIINIYKDNILIFNIISTHIKNYIYYKQIINKYKLFLNWKIISNQLFSFSITKEDLWIYNFYSNYLIFTKKLLQNIDQKNMKKLV